MTVRKVLTAVPVAGALTLLAIATGCGQSTAASSETAAAPPPVTLHYEIKPESKPGPDGRQHDAFTALDPTTVKVGQAVTIQVANYDDGQHSMTFTDLGLNLTIPGRDKNATDPAIFTYTFTPTKAGSFRWYCALPCDGGANARWAMSTSANGPGQDDFMAGYLTVST